jgi:hypothetical protein
MVLLSVHFPSQNSGWVVGGLGTVRYTVNNGISWIPQTSGTSNTLLSVHFPILLTGWAVGQTGEIIKTTNGGFNWIQQTSGTGNDLASVFFTNSATGWTTGGNGTILKTNTGGTTGVVQINSEIPKEFKLNQNYPNPFNPVTNFEFHIAYSRHVVVKVFDAIGNEVAELVDEQLKPGIYKVNFEGSNLASGVYFYKLTAGDFTASKKMILAK